MKINKFKFFVLIGISLMLLFTLSCQSEDAETMEQSEATLIKNDLGLGLIDLMSKMQQDNSGDDFVLYKIKFKNSKVEVLEESTIKRTRISESFVSFEKHKKSMSLTYRSLDSGPKTAYVCCTTDGETWDCVTCPRGGDQGICILESISACLDQGGCSTVCEGERRFIYDSVKDEFLLLPEFNN